MLTSSLLLWSSMMIINKCCWVVEVNIFMHSNQKKKLSIVESMCSCNSPVKLMCHVLSCCFIFFNFKILIICQNIDVTLLKPSKINSETEIKIEGLFHSTPSSRALPKASRALILLTTTKVICRKTHYDLHKYHSLSRPTNSLISISLLNEVYHGIVFKLALSPN